MKIAGSVYGLITIQFPNLHLDGVRLSTELNAGVNAISVTKEFNITKREVPSVTSEIERICCNIKF